MPEPDASKTVKGITKLSLDPATSTDPIAVGDNDPRVTAEFFSDSYASFQAAVAAIGTTRATLVVATSESFSIDVTVPSNINLRFTNAGRLTVASGKTLVIQGAIDAPPVQIFAGKGAVNLSQARLTAIYPDWFAAAGISDWAAAITQASQAAHDAGGGTVEFVRTYPFATQINLDGLSTVQK